jgi:ribose transport system permease protein
MQSVSIIIGIIKALLKNTIVVVFGIYFLIAALFCEGFLNPDNLLTIIMQSVDLFIIACGTTFLIINGGLDFSVAGIMGITSVLGVKIIENSPSIPSIAIAIMTMLAIGGGIGFINGLAVAKLKMPSFIATMATNYIFLGIALWYTKSTSVWVMNDAFVFIGQGALLNIPVPIIIAIFVGLGASYLYYRSTFGFYIRAIGTNQYTARISGIPVEKTIIQMFVISGFLIGVTSIIRSASVSAGIPTIGVGMIIDIIAAVLIGGTSLTGGKGTIVGTLLGAIFVITLDNSLSIWGLKFYEINICKGLVVCMIAFLESRKTAWVNSE